MNGSTYLGAVVCPNGFNGDVVTLHLCDDGADVWAAWSAAACSCGVGHVGAYRMPDARAVALLCDESAPLRAWVDAFTADVKRFPSAYKANVKARPGIAALQIVAGFTDAELARFTRMQRAETAGAPC